MKRLATIAALSAANLTLFAQSALAQSAKAFEKANCNASFLGCSGGGSAAPIGEMGSGSVELLLVAAAVLLFAGRPLLRKLGTRT